MSERFQPLEFGENLFDMGLPLIETVGRIVHFFRRREVLDMDEALSQEVQQVDIVGL